MLRVRIDVVNQKNSVWLITPFLSGNENGLMLQAIGFFK